MANEQPSLDVNDIDNAVRAIRLAQSRGAFELEEAATLITSVSRLEKWIDFYKEMARQQSESAKESKETSTSTMKKAGESE